ncbi:rab9 effector protein [Anaeramoeba ignava]|uniref:Rab9 effector protein n=1 Tax=Anaeramoeba ignava TaxID=1746090 RepID=A0A9Q0LMZ5_ANAIG|nr:rab9 effector protein [Anaeramoeba ignava]
MFRHELIKSNLNLENSCKSGFQTINPEEIISFGGSSGWGYHNNLYVFNVKTCLWKLIETSGDPPSPRSGVSTDIYKENFVYFFGGFDRRVYFDDFFKLDITTWTWESLPQKPQGRHSHSGNIHEDNYYIFGGRFDHDGTRDNILWKYSIKQEKWEQVEPLGKKPISRSSHIGMIFQDALYIYGGAGPINEALRDLHFYSIFDNTWNEIIVPEAEIPPPLIASSAVKCGSRLILVGGKILEDKKRTDLNTVFQYDFIQNNWSELSPWSDETLFPKRSSHVCALADYKIVLFGGEVLKNEFYFKHLNDVWILHLIQDLPKDLLEFSKQNLLFDI